MGMRVRLTKKTCEPDLVQEATGDVVAIAFHPEERFGDPISSNIRPADSHTAGNADGSNATAFPFTLRSGGTTAARITRAWESQAYGI